MEIGSFWEETQLPDNNSRHSTQSWGSIYQIWCICSDSNIRLLHRVQLGELLCWSEKRRKKICCLKGGINRIMEYYIWLIVELTRVTNCTYLFYGFFKAYLWHFQHQTFWIYANVRKISCTDANQYIIFFFANSAVIFKQNVPVQ